MITVGEAAYFLLGVTVGIIVPILWADIDAWRRRHR